MMIKEGRDRKNGNGGKRCWQYHDVRFGTSQQTGRLGKTNRPFSYSENEYASNDISLKFVEFSNVDNCDRSFNATLSNLENKIV